ncbi:Hypothetical protein PHPALM_12188 [Phytophthora palmivora]|uniref:Uncharacterized protein n=1 Tax=Phytophthora palmivora TaxID=4796 RepID=A0A2P4Y0C5_9STRA|nr:Hypothetical protein PHPALM_12188 [Phytophthora palmivora]
MMKDYVRRQLRYWVDDFKDNMLPRDFMTKSFTKTQLVLPDIQLKPHRIAAVLHLPSPLLVTSVRCIELTIAVPSWTDADKEAAHKPVLIHVNELLVQVRNIWECSSKIRRDAEERVQATLLKPDPLGSTAAMFEFAQDVNDRTKLVVDKLRVQIFVGGVSRVEVILVDLNARTTDALWQDVKDPTICVDYSPDHLIQTRFKAMSCLLSVEIAPAGSGVAAKAGTQTIRLMTKVSVAVRATRFYRRKEISEPWRRHMQLVDVNFGAMKLELSIAELMEVHTIASTLCNWLLNGNSDNSALSAVDGMVGDRESIKPEASDQQSVELQVTFRGTIEAKLKFTSPTEGPQELCFVADRAAGNVIIHRHGVRELQMSLHELAVRFRGYVVFRLKPDREVFHLEQRFNSLSVKWRVQSILCRVDDDLSAVLTEMYQFVNEKEQTIVIRCGTCHQQISLDIIDVHVCPPRNGSKSLPSTPHSDHPASNRSSFSESLSVDDSNFEVEEGVVKSIRVNGPPKVHAVLHMDQLELQTGSRLVQILIKFFGVNDVDGITGRDVTAKLSNVRLTTESNEFAGDVIFVPVLPLAFQMLECSLQGCGCVLSRKESTIRQDSSRVIVHNYHWPDRLFVDVAHFAISAQTCFVNVDKIQIRSSFSGGSRVCYSSQPQLCFHVAIDKIRCQLDAILVKIAREVCNHIGGSSSSTNNSFAMTLFLGVLQIRVVEFTLQYEGVTEARAKSLLKQAIVVFDNQLGSLCTHSSLDFKTILTSSTMKFVHRQTPALHTEPLIPQRQNTEPILLVVPPELEREDASRCIQRMVRRKQIVRQQKQRFAVDDYEPGVVNPIQHVKKSVAAKVPEPEIINISAKSTMATTVDVVSDLSSSPRKLSLGIPSPIMVLGPENDLAGEIRGGITKLMSPLSRARLPSDSIRGGINKLMGPLNRTLSPTGSVKRRPSVESVAPMVEVACYNVTTSEVNILPTSKLHELHDSEAPKQNSLSGAKLAALPDIVRVLVQVGECRLCVPINPREKVEYLCREIVRRFNESFTSDRGSISAVSLQDKHGGIFSPSDTIGFVLAAAPSELLFAYPYEHDGQIRSLARLAAGSSRTARTIAFSKVHGSQGPSTREDIKNTRYSKLPLPLVIALLANESERDLINSGLCERPNDATGEAWPNLALNASSLDAEKNPLIVEVAWREPCIEVMNGDAFALCRQLLGMCTSRTTSKYVGKILRSRLKVDSSNPLIEWAYRRKLANAMGTEARDERCAQPSDQEKMLDISYEQFKKIVQEAYGVYTQ